MIGTSSIEYFFMQICIVGLHYLAPLFAETLFYILIFLPFRAYLQREARHPPAPSREERRKLVQLCFDNIHEPESYLRTWFLSAQIDDIHRENLKEFCLWAFFNRDGPAGDDEEELNSYVQAFEKLLGRRLNDGWGSAKSFRLTLDRVGMLHRSLFWYFCIGKLPVVFIHGIGVGLYPYTKFFNELNSASGLETSDPKDQVGILLLEIMSVSLRITHPILAREEMCRENEKILVQHFGPEQKIVLVSHSYGSVITTHLLKDPLVSRRIDVAYNFSRRKPVQANELQLQYFASLDIGVAHTLARHFFWNENILWKKDLVGRKVTASLSGRDLIVNTEAVGEYLTRESAVSESARINGSGTPGEVEIEPGVRSKEGTLVKGIQWKNRDWKGDGIDILWFPHLDHGQVFDKAGTRRRVIEVVREYCMNI